MESHKFQEYIDYLRETVMGLVEFRERTGTLESKLQQVKDDLFDEDPFIVFGASVMATALLSDKLIYH